MISVWFGVRSTLGRKEKGVGSWSRRWDEVSRCLAPIGCFRTTRDLHLAPSLSQPGLQSVVTVVKATKNYMCSLDPSIYAGLLSSCYHIMVGAKEVFSNDRTRMISRIKTVQLKKEK